MWTSENRLQSQFLPFTMWSSGSHPQSSDLAAGLFIHRVSSQLPLPLFLFSLDSAMLFLALLLLLPKLTLPISLVVSPFFSGHIWRASCFLSRGLRFLPQRTCLGCDSLKSAQGALLNPPSLAPPTSSPQVLSLHPNSYRNLNCSQLKTQEKNVSTLVQST